MTNKHEEEQTDNTKKSKFYKKIIIISIFAIIIIGIVWACYYLVERNNASGQVNKFKAAVDNNNYSEISKTLSNNEDSISKTQAKYFVEYIKKPENYSKFKKEIIHIKRNINNDKAYNTNLGEITDSNKKNIVTVKKNGRKYFVLDNITFKPHLYDAYVKEYDNVGIYNYNIGKDMTTSVDKHNLDSVGKFFVGRYSIDTEKNIKDSLISGKVNGQLIIDTDNRNSKDQIIADDSFRQLWFKVVLSNNELLDNKSIKLHLNDKETEYKANKIYGKYPVSNNLSLYATGKYDGKEFKTKTIKVERNHDKHAQKLKLVFNKNEITKYKAETDKMKNNVKDFMNDYVKNLNKAYDKHDYSKVDKYIEPNSKLEKQLLKRMKHKQEVQYSEQKVMTINRENDNIKVIMEKQLKDSKIKSEYILKPKNNKKEFEIINYKDL
ncbi:TcaA NTF2-like domain-containing protein [Staphylococcus shinii]|uniref:TcaA NTF2-like domain-containing protein n=1 Tax=Staphylococcus shinii TaxID=2912228 RepID=UPI003F56BFD1